MTAARSWIAESPLSLRYRRHPPYADTTPRQPFAIFPALEKLNRLDCSRLCAVLLCQSSLEVPDHNEGDVTAPIITRFGTNPTSWKLEPRSKGSVNVIPNLATEATLRLVTPTAKAQASQIATSNNWSLQWIVQNLRLHEALCFHLLVQSC